MRTEPRGSKMTGEAGVMIEAGAEDGQPTGEEEGVSEAAVPT
jgi:hypothetical protein